MYTYIYMYVYTCACVYRHIYVYIHYICTCTSCGPERREYVCSRAADALEASCCATCRRGSASAVTAALRHDGVKSVHGSS